MSESKVKIYRSDLALLSHQYDIRVNAATEESEEKRSPQFYEKWTMGGCAFIVSLSLVIQD
jgi:hypothetical protein